MSLIGIFGGRGVHEESYLQSLRYSYNVLDAYDVHSTKDFRTLKLLIVPGRIAIYAADTLTAMYESPDFCNRIHEFLKAGGRMLICPPMELKRDDTVVAEKFTKNRHLSTDQSLTLAWFPVAEIKYRLRGTRRQIKLRKFNHPSTANLPDTFEMVTYGEFELPPNVGLPIASSNSKHAAITEVNVGSGAAVFVSPTWPFMADFDPTGTRIASQFISNVVEWGLNVTTTSTYFDTIVERVEAKYGATVAQQLRKADDSVRDRQFSVACEYAFKAFEAVVEHEGGNPGNLNSAIPNAFADREVTKSFALPERDLAHAIRKSRNLAFHGLKTPDQLVIDEVECFLSSIRYLIKSKL